MPGGLALLLRVWIRASCGFDRPAASLFVYPLTAEMLPMVPAIGASV